MIQLHRLEGFYWVARERGYARAARAFPYPITQPAVHQQVKKLESELGLALFERLTKDRLGLTPAGKALFDFVRPFFERLPSVVRQIRAGETGGELVIGAESLLLRHLLPGWLRRMQKRRPDAFLDLVEMQNPDPAVLLDGTVDVLVAWLPEIPKSVASLEVGLVHGFLAAPQGHPVTRKKRFTPRDFADDTFVGYHRDTRFAAIQAEVLARLGIHPERTVGAGSAETILGLVAGGIGYSIVPWLDPQGPRMRGVVTRPLEATGPRFPIYLAWRKDTPENPLLDALIATAPRD
ncbi:MAG: LysR family transcriptional regulator [Planctomycetota bacterium]